MSAPLASFASSASAPDRLIVSSDRLKSRQVVIPSGAGVVARGTVLGKQSAGTVPTTGTADGGNTGNGTVGSVAAGGSQIQVGTYVLICTVAASNSGLFDLIAPDGNVVGTAEVAVPFTSGHLDLTIADGSTDFVKGDQFTIAVTGTGKYVAAVAAAEDGSDEPDLILAQEADATSADVTTVAYERGDFDENELTFGAGHDADSVRETLRGKGIVLHSSITP